MIITEYNKYNSDCNSIALLKTHTMERNNFRFSDTVGINNIKRNIRHWNLSDFSWFFRGIFKSCEKISQKSKRKWQRFDFV